MSKNPAGSGIGLLAEIEKQIHTSVSPDFWSGTDSIFSRRENKPGRFAENVGHIQLFSILEATELFNNASEIFSEDRKHYVRELLRKALIRGNRRNLNRAPEHDICSILREEFPHFEEIIEVIEGAIALSRLSNDAYFTLPPLLLLGDPGLGKTLFCRRVGELLELDFKRIDIGTNSTSAILQGLSLGWATGHAGEVFRTLTTAEYANPVVMLDEIDKATGNDQSPIEPTLLSLLERESARNFKDEAMMLSIDASHINWVATANYATSISKPLLSRLSVLEVRHPDKSEMVAVAANIYQTIRASSPWGFKFEDKLSDLVLEKLSAVTPREASVHLRNAFGRAARKGRTQILEVDIPSISKPERQAKLGFI